MLMQFGTLCIACKMKFTCKTFGCEMAVGNSVYMQAPGFREVGWGHGHM